jgi:tripartite-type tricarboxylate transporter receptor subunit TctC
MPGADGTLAASRLSQARPDGLTVALIPVEAAVTRVLAMATPYVASEISGRLVVFEEPMALIAREGAPYDDLASLAEAARRGPVILGHDGLEPPSLSTLQVLALAKDMGVELKLKELPGLGPAHLREPRQTAPVIDVMAWPLSEVRSFSQPGLALKILAVLVDRYDGPCAPPGKALADQGRASPVHNLAALYEPSGPRGPMADRTLAAAESLFGSGAVKARLAADCLLPSELGLAGSEAALAAESAAQAGLFEALGLAPAD